METNSISQGKLNEQMNKWIIGFCFCVCVFVWLRLSVDDSFLADLDQEIHLLSVIVPGVSVDQGVNIPQRFVVFVGLGDGGQEFLWGLELGFVGLFQGFDVHKVFLND